MTGNNKKSSEEQYKPMKISEAKAQRLLEKAGKTRFAGLMFTGKPAIGITALLTDLLNDRTLGKTQPANISSLVLTTSNAAERLLGHPEGYKGVDGGLLDGKKALSEAFLKRIETPIYFEPLSDEAKEKIAELKAQRAAAKTDGKPGVK